MYYNLDIMRNRNYTCNKPSQAKPSQAKPSQAKPSQAFHFKLFSSLCLLNYYKILFYLFIKNLFKFFFEFIKFLYNKIVYIFEFFIHFSKNYCEKSIFSVFLIHEYHCMILVVCYNINKLNK